MQRQIDDLRLQLRELQQVVDELIAAQKERAATISRKPNIYARTPSGGIPAATGSDPKTPGRATCLFMERDGNGITNTATEIEVENSTSVAIPGGIVIQAKPIGERYAVDVGDC